MEDAAVEKGEARREHRHQEGKEGRHVAGSHVLVAPVHVCLRVVVHEQGASSPHVLPVDGDLSHGNCGHHRRGYYDDVNHDAEDLEASGASFLLQGCSVEVQNVPFFVAVSGLISMADGRDGVFV